MFQRLRDQLFGPAAGSGSPSSAGDLGSDTGSQGGALKHDHRPYHHSSSSLSAGQQSAPLSGCGDFGTIKPLRGRAQPHRQQPRPLPRTHLEVTRSASATGSSIDGSETVQKGMVRASSSLDIAPHAPLDPSAGVRQQNASTAKHARTPPKRVGPAAPAIREVAALPPGGSAAPPFPSSALAGYSQPDEAAFAAVMEVDPVDMRRLRELSWHGCPVRLRFDVWCLLAGHWHPQCGQRATIVTRKRREYMAHVDRAYGRVDWDAVCAVYDSGGADSAALRWRAEEAQQQSAQSNFGASGFGRRSMHSSPSSLNLLPAPRQALQQGTTMEKTDGANEMSGSDQQGGTSMLSFPSISNDDVTGENSPFSRPHYQALSPPQQLTEKRQTGVLQGGAAVPSRLIHPSALASASEVQIMKQIRKDIPRMSGGAAWLRHPRVCASIERLLFTWSLRHPACGYVQGMNDFTVPFFAVVLAHRYCATKSVSELYSYDDGMVCEKFGTGRPAAREHHNEEEGSGDKEKKTEEEPSVRKRDAVETSTSGWEEGDGTDASAAGPFAENGEANRNDDSNNSHIHHNAILRNHTTPSPHVTTDDTYIQKRAVDDDAVWLGELEADTFWLTSYVLSVMQDNYTRQQSGITVMVKRLERVLAAADATLYKHLTQELNIEIPLFAFRWVNCLLLRELTVTQSLRLFDAYLSDESRDWSSTHVFVCCAFLLRMSGLLMGLTDFAVALHILQNPPTERLSAKDMNEIISEAYVLQCLYANVSATTKTETAAAESGQGGLLAGASMSNASSGRGGGGTPAPSDSALIKQ